MRLPHETLGGTVLAGLMLTVVPFVLLRWLV